MHTASARILLNKTLGGIKQHQGIGLGFAIMLVFVLVACGSQPTGMSQKENTPEVTVLPPADVVRIITPTAPATQEPTPQPTQTSLPTPDYFSQAYPIRENGYVIPLTARRVAGDWGSFFFELQQPAEGKLIYRDVLTLEQGEMAFTADETHQMITIEGLMPGATYQACVLLGNEESGYQQPGFAGEEWGIIQFHTVSNDWPLRVGVLGDASFGDEATQALVDLMSTQNLDFVIHTGDVVYETETQDIKNSYMQKFYLPFKPLLKQGPVYTVLGNHDYDYAVRWQEAPFYDYAFPPFPDPDFNYPEVRRGNQYYALTYQDIQFILLDTHVFAGGEGREEQDSWLAERLADGRFRFSIPVFHVAPFSSSIVHPDDRLPVLYSWNWRFEQANVPLSLSGHFHHYERLIANGITYIVSGGGSSTLYAQGDLLPESQIYARRTHFVLLEIYPDRIKLSAISLEGDIIDRATILLD
jgi:predicted phosphodiesterase